MYYLRSQLEHYQIDVIHHKSFQNMFTRGDHFQFGSVFIKKKVTKPNLFFKKNLNRTETGSNRPISVRFGFLGQKPVWLDFFPVWVRFSFFGFRLIKPKPNRSVFSKF